MMCARCNKDLEDCECRDLPQRVAAILGVIVWGENYLGRVLKQVERVQGLNALDSVGRSKCPGCGRPSLDGHITCGRSGCNENKHRING